MRKCEKIVFDTIKDVKDRHFVYRSFLAEERKLQIKNKKAK